MECSGDNIIMQIKHSGGTNSYDPYWNVFILRRFSWNLTSKPQEIFKMLIKFIKFIVSSTVDIGLQESEIMRMDNTNARTDISIVINLIYFGLTLLKTKGN